MARCITPIQIKSPATLSYGKELQNYYVPCGTCPNCMKKKSNEWAFRMEEELKASYSAQFITLTYDDENVPLYSEETNDCPPYPVLHKRDVQLFLKRLRKKLNPVKLRFFACGEYGEHTHRPHYHMILFNVSAEIDYVAKLIEETWGLGFTLTAPCNHATIGYVAKYMIKSIFEENLPRQHHPFATMSTKPPIGWNYVKTMKEWHNADLSRLYAVRQNGSKIPLPRTFKKHLYDETQILLATAQNIDKITSQSDKQYQRNPEKFLKREEQSKQSAYLQHNKTLKKSKL